QFGDDGKAFCKDIEKSAPKARKYDNSDMFGGHCGGVCCKSFLALAHLLHGDNTTADKIRLEAAAYAKDQDDTSRLIARAYTRMYRIFQHDFVVALDNELIISGEYADEGPPAAGYWAAKITRAVTIDDASGDWRVFDNLVRACAYVGCCWERCRNSTLNENDKNDIQALCRAFEVLNREWNSKECLSLWGTYEAVAWALLREDDRANELFRTTSEKALAREEKFYLPELYRLWSECLQRRGDTRAEEKRQDGLQFAAGMPLFERWLKSPG
ncbi:MAG TPA: hypothetical protein VFI31_08320, partial [Pirellulales bacterium]|nr:hypothetical protein [Pirellulales bacterium]